MPLLAPVVATAADGQLDTSFAGSGMYVGGVAGKTDFAQDVLQLADGKVLVAARWNTGDAALLRFTADGALDTTFDGNSGTANGIVVYDTGAYNVATTLAVQADGNYLLAGEATNGTYRNFAVTRFLADGRVDTTFSGDGLAYVGWGNGNDDLSGEVVVQPDGKILVAGRSYDGTTNRCAVARFNADGTLDATFDGPSGSGNGKVRFDSLACAKIESVRLRSDGRILLAGQYGNDVALLQLNANGTLDATFDGDSGTGNGVVVRNLSGTDRIGESALAVLGDGRVLVAGTADVSTEPRGFVIRMHANGTTDTSFGTSGTSFAEMTTGGDDFSTIDVLPDGKLALTGDVASGDGYAQILFARMNAGGGLDPTFAGTGWRMVRLGPAHADANAASLQADGRMLVVGQYDVPAGDDDVFVARMEHGGEASSIFTSNGSAALGSANPDNIVDTTPQFSWLNPFAALAAALQRIQVTNTPPGDAVSLHRFDGDLMDASGNGHAAVKESATHVAGQAGFGSALDLNAATSSTRNGYIPTHDDYRLGQFTIDFWYNQQNLVVPTSNPNLVNRVSGMLACSDVGRRNFVIQENSTEGRIVASVTVGNGATRYSATSNGPADANWHHYALVATGSNGELRAYIDGVRMATTTIVGSIDTVDAPVTVGYRLLDDGTTCPPSNSLLDDLRISARPMGDDEIADHYAARQPHGTVLWDSDPAGAGAAIASCAGAARCADVSYGSTGSAPSALDMTGRRYWVRTQMRTGGILSSWSDWDWFATGANAAPSAPTLVSPSDSATGVAVSPTFTATFADPDPDPGTLEFQVCSDSTCTSVARTGSSGGVTSGSNASWSPTTALAGATQYWWRARGVDTAGSVGAWSTIRTFTTAMTVTGATPGSAPQGRKSLTVQVSGSAFQSGASAAFSGTGITVISTTFVSSTRIDVVVDIAGNATTGARDITVTNPDTTSATGSGLFTVQSPSISVGLSVLGYDATSRDASSPYALSFGGLLPGTPRQVGPSGSGQATAGAAVIMDVTSNTDVDIAVSAADFTGPAALTAGQLAWKRHGVAEAWTPMGTSAGTIESGIAPATFTRSYDYQLSTPATQVPGSYSTSVTYTVTAMP